MITIDDYYMGRDRLYAKDLTDAIRENSPVTVERANELLSEFGEARGVNSGWRPPLVNAAIPRASKTSLHMTGQAIDIADFDGRLDDWCLRHLDILARIGLWLESPTATKGWCHVQTIGPRSGNRVFLP